VPPSWLEADPVDLWHPGDNGEQQTPVMGDSRDEADGRSAMLLVISDGRALSFGFTGTIMRTLHHDE
jgi:hypothetical protein